MITRIRAVRSALGMMLTLVELIIGFSFLVKIIGFNDSFEWLSEGIENFSGQAGYADYGEIKGPVTFLFVVLAFMLFSFTIIVFLPGIVEKTEKEMDVDLDLE